MDFQINRFLLSVEQGNLGVVLVFLDKSIYVDLVDDEGVNVFYIVLVNGDEKVVSLLLL